MNLTRVADPANWELYRATSVTISGSGFDWHDMESYLRSDGIGKYSFVGDHEIVFNKTGKQFDAVIMSDCGQCPVKLKSIFCEYAKKQTDTVVKHGASPAFFYDMGLQRQA